MNFVIPCFIILTSSGVFDKSETKIALNAYKIDNISSNGRIWMGKDYFIVKESVQEIKDKIQKECK
jgi:hypothetical protein